LQSIFDALYPPGLQWHWRADSVKKLGDEAIDQHIDLSAPTRENSDTAMVWDVILVSHRQIHWTEEK